MRARPSRDGWPRERSPALRAAGRWVPEDVAVVGFDASPPARRTDPRLTTVRRPVEEMGRTTAGVPFERMRPRGLGRRAAQWGAPGRADPRRCSA
ncbi:substrate-binding domain-containing protein [Streptomyces sp. NPDC018833]|uniref:substrate-binding domain-containing protein n=1 Tax=Streptomyces sp. NPDC018833 TaxID=3365053 RepID=UPI0037ADC4CE